MAVGTAYLMVAGSCQGGGQGRAGRGTRHQREDTPITDLITGEGFRVSLEVSCASPDPASPQEGPTL